MKKIIIFAGTTEGRQLTEQLDTDDIEIYACVATEYGREQLKERKNLHILTGRLTEGEMAALMTANDFRWAVDATHPYAVEVTQNIQAAAKKTNTEYLRLYRESERQEGCLYFKTMDELIAYLDKTEGNILLTTGSKQLESFTRIKNYRERIYPRVLPSLASIGDCNERGFESSHIIAMQGPFTEEMNLATIGQYHIKVLVAKDSGSVGGFKGRISAAQKAGVTVLVLKRPSEEEGHSLEKILEILNYGGEER